MAKIKRYLSKFTFTNIKKGITLLVKGQYSFVLKYLEGLYSQSGTITFIPNNLDLADIEKFYSFANDAIFDTSLFSKPIDIIVPIYNGMAFLPKLFDSVLENTLIPFRLIIVDDKSSDPLVSPFLNLLKQKYTNVILVTNQENLGFVKSVNRAATFADNHFVLLNTDVEVPKGWLERLMRPIVENQEVASVTPFTNSGTICSFPRPQEDNPLFMGLDLNTIDAVFKRIDSSYLQIEVPTGVGFCMGINKKIWDEIGPFDEEKFGRGYGEENDWCMRAISRGYKNVVATNLFVYHKHGGSFPSAEKQRLAEENMKKLIDMHPTYLSQVSDFISADPLRPFRDFAKFILLTDVAEKVIFIIDHAIGGGANGYRKRFIQNELEKGHTVFLLTYNTEQLALELKVMNAEQEIVFRIKTVDDLLLLEKHIPKLDEIIYNNLVSYDHPLEILETVLFLKKRFSAKLTVLVHDYYLICPSYTLLDYQGNYCDVPDLGYCQKCLPENLYAPQNIKVDLKTWRTEWYNFLTQSEEVVCFSESSCKILRKAYDIPLSKILFRPHRPLYKFEKPVKILAKKPLSIGVVGALNYAKGSQMVIDVAKIFASVDKSVLLTVIGSLSGYESLPDNVTVTGAYTYEDLPNLLEKYNVNLCFFSSIWPETFSYVVGELMDLEMPICAFDLGAQAERIRKYKFGHVIQKVDAETAVREIAEFYVRFIR